MSVERRGARWRVRWRDASGANRSRTFADRRQAALFDAAQGAHPPGGRPAAQRATLAEWVVGEWWPAWQAHHRPSLSTQRLTLAMWEREIRPALGTVRLDRLDRQTVRRWHRDVCAAHPGRRWTNTRALGLLSRILAAAVDDDRLAVNPCDGVSSPRQTARPSGIVVLAPATVEQVRARMLDRGPRPVAASTGGQRPRRAHRTPDRRGDLVRLRDATLVSTLAYGGLRPAEATALTWGQVRERTLTVDRQRDTEGRSGATKSARGRRAVRLLAPLAADLAAWRAVSRPSGLRALVFARPDGGPWRTSAWQSWRVNAWGRACEDAGLVPIPRPYDLRHSFASLLLAEGRTVHDVAGQLGHSPTLTLDVYGHLFAEHEGAARVDAEQEIRQARDRTCTHPVPTDAPTRAVRLRSVGPR